MSTDMTDALTRCRLFAAVDQANMATLAAMARRQRFEAQRVIFRQGDACPGLFVVTEGRVRVYKLAPSGKEHVLHLAGPGQTFAEAAVVGGFDCPAFAEALEPTTCVLLPSKPFRAALQDSHSLCLQLLGGMAGWVHHLVDLLEDIALRDAVGRVARYLADAGDAQGAVRLPALKRHLASHLNLTSETLSRSLRKLLDAGLIAQQDGGTLTIVDRDALRDIAEGM